MERKWKYLLRYPPLNSDKYEKEYPSNNSFNHVGGDDCDCSICKVESEEDESDKEDSEDHESEDGGTDEYLSDDDEPEMDEYWASAEYVESRLLYDYWSDPKDHHSSSSCLYLKPPLHNIYLSKSYFAMATFKYLEILQGFPS